MRSRYDEVMFVVGVLLTLGAGALGVSALLGFDPSDRLLSALIAFACLYLAARLIPGIVRDIRRIRRPRRHRQ